MIVWKIWAESLIGYSPKGNYSVQRLLDGRYRAQFVSHDHAVKEREIFDSQLLARECCYDIELGRIAQG